MTSWPYGANGNPSTATRRGGCATFIFLCLVVLAVNRCQSSDAPLARELTPVEDKGEPRFVATSDLECRHDDSDDAATVARLDFGTEVTAIEVNRFWTRISSGKARCWVPARFLTETRLASPLPR